MFKAIKSILWLPHLILFLQAALHVSCIAMSHGERAACVCVCSCSMEIFKLIFFQDSVYDRHIRDLLRGSGGDQNIKTHVCIVKIILSGFCFLGF